MKNNNQTTDDINTVLDSQKLVEQLKYSLKTFPQKKDFTSDDVLSLFESGRALGSKTFKSGLLGIAEFMSMMDNRMVERLKPKTYGDVLRLSGLSHGKGLWRGNAETLLDINNVTFNEIITTKEDLAAVLSRHYVDYNLVNEIVENVSSGRVHKGACPHWREWSDEMTDCGIPGWFIWSCEHIENLLGKAELYDLVNTELTAMYYKLYCPYEFYETFFDLWGTNLFRSFYPGRDADYDSMLSGFLDYEERVLTDPLIRYADYYMYLVWDEAFSRDMRMKQAEFERAKKLNDENA